MTTIVMTGGTSGLGAVAATRLVREPGVTLILGARVPSGDMLPLDLARLASVRAFADAALDRLGDAAIDALVLNAGVYLHTDKGRTADGFETTFAVNHLSHQFLLQRLLPRLADGARVVITSSGTHDPAEGTRLPPPRHADARLLAWPEQDPQRDAAPRAAGGRAYSSSKLCNVLMARAVRALPEARARHLTVVAWTPGPTAGTGLLRSTGLGLRLVGGLFATSLGQRLTGLTSPEDAGAALAALALGRITPPEGALYAKLKGGVLQWIPPSELARDLGLADALWADSAALIGVEDGGVRRA
ncbi:MAG: SDR family NAD(P)-dependent oxidoreductase [Alphaproteobacteria bacterium]|nr:SDR family NAD(P)-dependent oxidoreductase [Alphaproteobacteria bacterium]